MFSKVNSLGLSGFGAEIVEVEADLSSGLPRFDLVGLPSSAVSESKQRVHSAIKNCGLKFPVSRITVNLAPAEFRKEGPIYDLPILIAILSASGQLKAELSDCALIGEISLDGNLRRINGVLPMTVKAESSGIKKIFVPSGNLEEASLIPGIEVYPVRALNELLEHLRGEKLITPLKTTGFNADRFREVYRQSDDPPEDAPDFSDVIGQSAAKRALEVAAAGNHNVLLIGSPGSGKSMLAKRLPGIMPDMSFDEIVETTAVYSVAGALSTDVPVIAARPFRAPHHASTAAAMAGGGRKALPGEVSLAHNGVLFLDELPLFSRAALDVLRQPIEDGRITVARSASNATYPANVLLICAMNPCPCGYLTDDSKECSCSENARRTYLSKISGPLFDRIDIAVNVERPDCKLLISGSNAGTPKRKTSKEIRSRVAEARKIQLRRFEGTGIRCNAQMTPSMVKKYCIMTDEAKEILIAAFERLGFSARANDKILKTARTIADLEKSDLITIEHISEAVQYRSVDRLI